MKVGVRVSRFDLHSSVLLSVSLGIQLWIFFLNVFIGWLVKSFSQRGRFEILLLFESFSEGLVLNLQQFSIRINVLVFQGC